jgi:DNA uptake protein ComE-like DNA-binding protein
VSTPDERQTENKARAADVPRQKRNESAELLDRAEHFHGSDTNDILLGKEERLFLCVTNTSLVQERRRTSASEGRGRVDSSPSASSGGSPVRYAAGSSHDEYVQGTPTITANDTGNAYITNKRVVFRGATQTRECLFSKLIGFEHNPAGRTTFWLSNRQKPTTIEYGAQVSGVFSFRLDLAIAHYRGTLPQFISDLRRGVETTDTRQRGLAVTSTRARAAPERTSQRASRWPFISLIPLGFGAWAPMYAGIKARQQTWILAGITCSAIVLAGFVKSTLSASGHSGNDTVAGFLIIVGWVAAIATSFIIRGSYDRQMKSRLLLATEAGEDRLNERRRALQTARENPALAREIGVGRPDNSGAFDAGLVDVNNASARALVRLPGIDDALATRIVETRAQTNGFSSVEDLGTVLDLPGDLVERLREDVVFLPRE